MKKRLWLFWILAFLLMVNTGYYFVSSVLKPSEYIQKKLIEYCKNELNLDLQIKSINLNDKEVTINGINLKNDDMKIYVKKVYVNYQRLLSIIFLKPKLNNLTIYDPVIEYNVNPDFSSSGSKFELPDIASFIKQANIYNATFKISYKSKFVSVVDSLYNINFKGNAKGKNFNFELTAKNDYTKKFVIKGITTPRNIDHISLDLKNYKPKKAFTKYLNKLNFSINANCMFASSKPYFYAEINNIEVKRKWVDVAGGLVIWGDDFSANLKGKNLTYNGTSVTLNLDSNLKSLSQNVNGTVITDDVDINHFTRHVKGKAKAVAKVSGSLPNLIISGQCFSKKLFIHGQNFTNIKSDFSFNNYELVKFSNTKIKWQKNNLNAEGQYHVNSGLNAIVYSNNLKYFLNGFSTKAKLRSIVTYSNKNKTFINANLSNLSLNLGNTALSNLKLNFKYKPNSFAVKLADPQKQLSLDCKYKNKNATVSLVTKRLELNKILNIDEKRLKLPAISGNTKLSLIDTTLAINTRMRVYDEKYGKFDGIYYLNYNANLKQNLAKVDFYTKRARFNYKPYEISFKAEGTPKTLKCNNLVINERISGDFFISIAKGLYYNFNLNGKKVQLDKYFAYFLNHFEAKKYKGKLDFAFNYDSKKNANLNAKINDFSINSRKPANINISISGKTDSLTINTCKIFDENASYANVEGIIKLAPEFVIDAKAKLKNVPLDLVFDSNAYTGKINGEAKFIKDAKNNYLAADVYGKNLSIENIPITYFNSSLVQKNKSLIVKRLSAFTPGEHDLTISGELGYNFLTKRNFASDSTLTVSYKGDLLSSLSKQINFIGNAYSESDFNFDFSTNTDGLSIKKGNFVIKNGELSLANQSEKISRISVDLEFNNDLLGTKKFSAYLGNQKLYISSKILNNENDFKLGKINLGQFYIETGEKGILFNFPGYMPKGQVANFYIKGRDSEKFEIKGPFDEIKMIGDIEISNAGAIFPPNTKNIVNLFTNISLQNNEKVKDVSVLPFELDLMIVLTENNRYITYPADIRVNPGSYIHVQYIDGVWKADEANFTASQGNLELFGTSFEAEEVQVIISKYSPEPYIYGSFSKKTSDGTVITLDVFSGKNSTTNAPELTLKLASDNPDDTTDAHILARLTYNRSLDDLSPQQQQTLLQDEAIQLAGLGIASAIIDPLIVPLQNQIRKFLRLDSFSIKPGWVQNLLRVYANTDLAPGAHDESQNLAASTTTLSSFGTDILLDNMVLEIGKYIRATRNKKELFDIFVNYELLFEKSSDISVKNKAGIDLNHTISARYDLPYKFKILYKLNIDNKKETAHELMLERSFKF